MHACTHTRTHTYIHTYIHTQYIHTYIHTYTCTYLHAWTNESAFVKPRYLDRCSTSLVYKMRRTEGISRPIRWYSLLKMFTIINTKTATNFTTNELHNVYTYGIMLQHVSAIHFGHYQGAKSLIDQTCSSLMTAAMYGPPMQEHTVRV
jgi:hypothetical protein